MLEKKIYVVFILFIYICLYLDLHGSRAMASNYKIPPKFTEETSYEVWKNELDMWKCVTDLPKSKQALAVALSLNGKPREVALEISSDKLNKDDGMEKLIEALDKVFLTDNNDNAYAAYSNFESCKKDPSMTMTDFIIEFERKYNRTKKFNMTLPDNVLAFKLLDCCCLTVGEKQLALTAITDTTLSGMKTALKRIFSEKISDTSGPDTIRIKQEPESAYYTKYRTSGYRQYKTNDSQQTQWKPQGGYQSKQQTGMNPLNRFGKPTRCSVCQSIFHWRKNCPDEDKAEVRITSHHQESEIENNFEPEQCNITLFTKSDPSINEVFVLEAQGCAVLDTACTRTVCGEKWLDHYLEQLNKKDKLEVVERPSSKLFRFGDGNPIKSKKLSIIPATIADTRCNIETEVVSADIPLLLSKSSLQKAETVIDTKNDKAEMFNKIVNLEQTSSGHYCINILAENDQEDVTPQEIALIVQHKGDKLNSRKILTKLHQQFGHCSSDKLSKLLQSSGAKEIDHEMLQNIVKSCETSVKYRSTPLKPVVGLPMSCEFNETVAVDLHELENGIWYLHIIDLFTRFSAGSIVKTKKSSEFIKKFLQGWVSIFGAPKKLLNDNGGKFNSKEVRDMAENFNIEVKTTAAYSPWSNRLLERHNRTLTEIMLKIKHDHSIDWETNMSWALMAKNALQNVHGFSPYQLVYGRNPNLPSVLHDKLPALEGKTYSQTVGDHIIALHNARKAFIESEHSERIRRAIRKQVRPSGERFVTGEKVFYKHPDYREWKGPGTVIGQDSAVVFVRHGGSYVRVHQSRLQRVQDTGQTERTNGEITSTEVTSVTRKNDTDENVPSVMNNCDDFNSCSESEDVNEEEQKILGGNIKLKAGEMVSFKEADSDTKSFGKILSRTGKDKGPLKGWYNFEYVEPEDKCGTKISIDLSKVQDLEKLTVSEQEDSVLIVNDEQFDGAKLVELENWKQNKVYEEVENTGQKTISTRWVCTLKETKEGLKPKARLVARGFEDWHTDIQKDSPTCLSESFRTALAVIAQKQWDVHTIDIKTAFLQSAKMSRTVYIRPPREANSKNLWKLNKCVYGLSDASLEWYKRVCEVMVIQTHGNKSKADPAIFFWKNTEENVIGIIACHVDDFIWGGDDTFKQTIIPQIREAFLVGSEKDGNFSYVGINIKQQNQVIYLDQQNYADSLQSIDIEKSRQKDKLSDLTQTEKDVLRSKLGQLLWIARQNRPDVLYDVCHLAAILKNAKVEHIIEANKIIRKIKAEHVVMKYQHLGRNDGLKIVCYSDASMGNLSDGATQGASFIALVGENGRFSPLYWQSKRIRRVVKSTLAAETLAMTEAIDNAVFIAMLFSELYYGRYENIPLVCVTDNRSLLEAIRSNKGVAEKRLRIDIGIIKEMIDKKQIEQILWSDTKEQLADCLTKHGASSLDLLSVLNSGILTISGL